MSGPCRPAPPGMTIVEIIGYVLKHIKNQMRHHPIRKKDDQRQPPPPPGCSAAALA